MDDNNKIISLMEIPFKEGGRDKYGCDCWGLVKIFYKDIFNIELPSFGNIYLDSTNNYLETSENIENLMSFYFEKKEFPEFGNIIFINMLGRPVHIGIVLNNKEMIHTIKNSGVKIEDFSGVKWNKRITGYYKLITN